MIPTKDFLMKPCCKATILRALGSLLEAHGSVKLRARSTPAPKSWPRSLRALHGIPRGRRLEALPIVRSGCGRAWSRFSCAARFRIATVSPNAPNGQFFRAGHDVRPSLRRHLAQRAVSAGSHHHLHQPASTFARQPWFRPNLIAAPFAFAPQGDSGLSAHDSPSPRQRSWYSHSRLRSVAVAHAELSATAQGQATNCTVLEISSD